jgi:hypothetical protein
MPRIKTTPMVKAALWALRIYLLVLLSLIILKFTRVFSDSHKQYSAAPSPTVAPATATNQPTGETKP